MEGLDGDFRGEVWFLGGREGKEIRGLIGKRV